MRLTQLNLHQFRKFEHLQLMFPLETNVVCFVGPNTVGKTNIVEAMYFLSLYSSFRTKEVVQLLEWDKDFFSVSCHLADSDYELLRINQVFRPRKQRKCERDGVSVSLSEYIGSLMTVFFSPDEISMLMQAPANRRRYLDMLLCQTDKSYFFSLYHYQKVVKYRNSLLKNINKGSAQRDELMYWNEEMADHALTLTQKRTEMVERFNQLLPATYQAIAQSEQQSFQIEYKPKLTPELATKSAFLQALDERLPRDIILESTTLGPHRDSVEFVFAEKRLQDFASRGDTRSMVLALKFTEIQYIQEKTSQTPILILDDVFSELDRSRQEHLLTFLPPGIQTFITTTSEDIGVLEKRKQAIHFIHVGDLS